MFEYDKCVCSVCKVGYVVIRYTRVNIVYLLADLEPPFKVEEDWVCSCCKED